VTAQKELSERQALRAEERAMARDTAEKAAPGEALRRYAAPPATPPPPTAGFAAGRLSPSPAPAAPMPADERFSGAANAFAAREYAGAAEGFRAFLTEQPHDRRAAEARFYLAESLFAQERYTEAASLYAEFLKERPDHPLAVTALYRQGLARLAAGDSSGCALLKGALERAPRARDAAAAKEALARCP
jgi:TolA-binding protein